MWLTVLNRNKTSWLWLPLLTNKKKAKLQFPVLLRRVLTHWSRNALSRQSMTSSPTSITLWKYFVNTKHWTNSIANKLRLSKMKRDFRLDNHQQVKKKTRFTKRWIDKHKPTSATDFFIRIRQKSDLLVASYTSWRSWSLINSSLESGNVARGYCHA